MDRRKYEKTEHVRVAVQFKRPHRSELPTESGAARYQRVTGLARHSRDAFLRWLKDQRVNYWRMTPADAFSTVFIDVEAQDVARLRQHENVERVSLETSLEVELLNESDDLLS